MKLLQTLKENPQSISFQEAIAFIDEHYEFTPTRFVNGITVNEAGQNNGSCKIFAFGLMHGLSAEQTLSLFGDYYRKDVLGNPDGTDHANIRNFMLKGWEGIHFEGDALKAK